MPRFSKYEQQNKPSITILNEHFPMFPAESVAVYFTSVEVMMEYGGTACAGSTVIFGADRELSSAIGMVQLAIAVPLWPRGTRIFDGQDLVNTGGVLSK